MSHNAPFTAPEATDEAPNPMLSLLLFIVATLTPIIVCGPLLNLWDFSLLFSVIGALVVIWIYLRSIVSIGFVRHYPFMTEPIMRMFILIVGIVLLMFPIALYAGIHPGSMVHLEDGDWPVMFSSTIFSTVQAVTLNLSPGYWIEDAHALGILSDLLLSVHALLIFFYAIACPLAAVSAAVDALVNGISDLRIRFWSWRKTHGSTMGEIYVFHELEEHGTALVRSILETRKSKLPLIIFANIGDAEASRDETLMEDILDRARGKANVLFTSLPAEAIPRKLSKHALETCAIRYFAITQNSTENIHTCGEIWDATFEQLWSKTWEIWNKTYGKQSRHLSPGDYGELCKKVIAAICACAMGDGSTRAQSGHATGDLDPAAFRPLLRMGDRLAIHCMYTNLVDVALLDSMTNHNVQHIMDRLREDCQEYREEIAEGVSELASSLRGLVDMRLLRQAELSVQDLFERHPLYEVLDPITLGEDDAIDCSGAVPAEEQQLTVLILGCGEHGVEALKTAFLRNRSRTKRYAFHE